MTNRYLEVVDVWKRFDDKDVIRGVSFTVSKGETFVLMGPNGSGKTTLASIIAGVLRPNRGSVKIRGLDIVKEWTKSKENISYLPQSPSVFPYLTGLENLMFYGRVYGIPKDEIKIKIPKLLRLVGLVGHENKLVRDYSGGMQRKLEIATTLLSDSEILILDEPTTGLDPVSRNEIRLLLSRFKKEEKTLILVTHLAEDAEALGDRLAFMVDGKIIAKGSPTELKSKCNNLSVLRIKTPIIRNELYNELRRRSYKSLITKQEYGYKIFVPISRSDEVINSIRRLQDLDVSVVNEDMTLEDVFMILTERSLTN